MKTAQFLVKLTGGGRGRMIRNIHKSLDAKAYTLNAEKDVSEDYPVTDPEGLRERIRAVKNLDPEIEFLEEFDVVITHSSIGAVLLEDIDVETVVMNHGASKEQTYLFEEYIEASDPTSEYFSRDVVEIVRAQIAALLDTSDLVVANSNFIQERLRQYFGIESEVIYDPVDRQKFVPKDNSSRYFLSVQRLDWRKRIERQIEAFEDTDKELLIVGSGELEDEIEKYAVHSNNIRFKGWREEKELLELYRNASALIHTGLPEDCPNVIREAQSCGTPVIAPKIGPNPELINSDTGFLYEEGNLRRALQEFESESYDVAELRESTERFGLESFRERFTLITEEKLNL